MHFREISLKNWRNHQLAKIPLTPKTLIVGRMGSGKTAILEGTRFAITQTIETDEKEVKQIGMIAEAVANHGRKFGAALTNDKGQMLGWRLELSNTGAKSLVPVATMEGDPKALLGKVADVWTLSDIRSMSPEKLKQWFFKFVKPKANNETRAALMAMRDVKYWKTHDVLDLQAEVEKTLNGLRSDKKEAEKLIASLTEQTAKVPAGNLAQLDAEYDQAAEDLGGMKRAKLDAEKRTARMTELRGRIERLEAEIGGAK